MKKRLTPAATAALAVAAVVTLSASGATAAGPKGPSCGTFKVRKNEKIVNHPFPKGTYRLHAIGISCAKVSGKYGLFDQFLSQDDDTPLPRPWRFLAGAVGAPKFSAAPGVGFRAQRISR